MKQTKVKVVPTIFVLAVLVVAWITLPPLQQLLDREDGSVTLLVEFEPRRRSGKTPPGRTLADKITIHVNIGIGKNADIWPPEYAFTSPWERVIYPPKGRHVQLRAEQFYGTKITCMARQGGQKASTQTKTGAAFVRCGVTVV